MLAPNRPSALRLLQVVPIGPASRTLVDPDGNVILFDQHVTAPKK